MKMEHIKEIVSALASGEPEEFAKNAGSLPSQSDSESTSSSSSSYRRKRRRATNRAVHVAPNPQVEKLESRIHYMKLDMANQSLKIEEQAAAIVALKRAADPYDQINQLLAARKKLLELFATSDSLTAEQMKKRITSLRERLEANSTSIQSYNELIERNHYLKELIQQNIVDFEVADYKRIETMEARMRRQAWKENAMMLSLWFTVSLVAFLTAIAIIGGIVFGLH